MMACDESANQESHGDDEFDITGATSATSFLFPRHRIHRMRARPIAYDRFPAASHVRNIPQDLPMTFAARILHFPFQHAITGE
jgi:hypothetical protein